MALISLFQEVSSEGEEVMEEGGENWGVQSGGSFSGGGT